MKKLYCLLCGKELDYTPGKPGRPPELCPPKPEQKNKSNCATLWGMLPWMEEVLFNIDKDGMTAQKRKELRSRLMSARNLLNYKVDNKDIIN